MIQSMLVSMESLLNSIRACTNELAELKRRREAVQAHLDELILGARAAGVEWSEIGAAADRNIVHLSHKFAARKAVARPERTP